MESEDCLEFKIPRMDDSVQVFEDGNNEDTTNINSPSVSLTKQFEGSFGIRHGSCSSTSSFAYSPSDSSNYCEYLDTVRT